MTRLDGVGAADGLHACFGKAEVLDLAFLNQVLHRSRYVFDGHVRVNAMLIEQVDDIHLEPLERALGGLLDVLRPAVQARRTLHPAGIEIGLRSNPNLVAITTCLRKGARASPTSSSFGERAVDLGGVEERDAAFHGCAEQRGHLLLVFGRAVRKAHSHAAEPESRDFQAAISQVCVSALFLLRNSFLSSPG